MTSRTQKTKRIRANKDRPNKRNRKADEERLEKNAQALERLAAQEPAK